ncbi:MAG: hypothetical protein DWQ31_21455 [Planctomycetota bacterium]|nr:MAG: hypothetical protein DWQ31_21455 [Planctomycetota bacterium]REJ93671.1 MAG: hypothetical protein DWQ35_09990 [Planctomycetota bacterium]REK25720.1 MAG: hypothetical protein DWQ42_10730 [Planctomycetota bacterium]REK46534.1 MAG: hypothetical protein DWQ46_06575 [Planctomycetota bacterium]
MSQLNKLPAFWLLFAFACGAPAAETETPAVRDLRTRTDGVDWPRFLGPTGDSKSPERGILTEWPAQGPRLVWETRLGTSYAMPSIERGRLFMFDRHGDQARLTCLESETGRPLWNVDYPTNYEDHFGYNNGPRCCPVVDGDRVYTYGVEGMLLCRRVSDGREVWRVDTMRQFGVVPNFFGVASAPVVEDELLIVCVGGSPADMQGLSIRELDQVEPNGTAIVAFDKRTGKVKYKLGEDLASYTSPTFATIGDRRWGFAFMRGGLIGFDPRTGEQDFYYPWRARMLESVNASTPVAVGDEVFISETYGPGSSLLRVRPGNFDVVWSDPPRSRQRAMQMHWNTPIHVDGYLYGSSGRHSGSAELRCIDWKTGEVKWRKPRLGRASLLYVDGHFLCLSEDGILRLLQVNPEKYEPIAVTTLNPGDADSPRPRLQYPAWAAPILSHGLLYVRGRERLVCLELIPAR